MDSADDLNRCLVLNTVSAARILLRRYDQVLKPHGVTVQQFALLSAIRFHPSEPVTRFAQKIGLDRTSLTRNLDLLENKGLVARAADAGNARICVLTSAGEHLLDLLHDRWVEEQSALAARVSEDDAAAYLRVAKALASDGNEHEGVASPF